MPLPHTGLQVSSAQDSLAVPCAADGMLALSSCPVRGPQEQHLSCTKPALAGKSGPLFRHTPSSTKQSCGFCVLASLHPTPAGSWGCVRWTAHRPEVGPHGVIADAQVQHPSCCGHTGPRGCLQNPLPVPGKEAAVPMDSLPPLLKTLIDWVPKMYLVVC